MAFQHWYCEWCGEDGTVQHKKHAGVWEVKEQISAQHRRYFPACAEMQGLSQVRLGFPPKGFAAKKREPVTV